MLGGLRCAILALALSFAYSSLLERVNRDALRVDRRSLTTIDLQPLQPELLTTAAAVAGKEGSSDITTSIFNLAKTILGSGILSLPAAVAAFSDQTQALSLATLILVVMGAVSAYSFSSIGNACQQHQVGSFQAAWAASVNPESGSAIALLITLKTFFACLAYSIIIGDSFASLARAFGLDARIANREVAMSLLTSTVVLPLCLQKSLDALKYTSLLGLFGIVYCAVFMAIRWYDGSYASGGKFLADITSKMRPSFGVRGTLYNEKVFILLSTMATAYVAHYNAPKFWTELRQRSMSRYNLVVYSAFGFAAIMYFIVMVIGFNTFGGNSSGFILNNYSSKDILATFGRLAIGGGILFGYPLTFSALRDGSFDLLRFSDKQREHSRVLVTVSLLVLLTVIAMPLKNLGLVLSLSGSLIGSALIYIIPAVTNLKNIPKRKAIQQASKEGSLANSLELLLNYGIIAMGLAVSVIGVKTTLQGAAH